MADTDTPLLSARFDAALAYASAAHRRQIRKGSNVPYVSHLLGVCAIALENGGDEDQAIAALLHDAVEDQGGQERLADIRTEFGDRVAEMVADCTDDLDSTKVKPRTPEEKFREWVERKKAYIASLPKKPRASLEVSLADKTHNAGAINTDLRAEGEAVWKRFTGKKDGTLWYYRSLSDAFSALVPGTAAARFMREVEEMEQLAG